MALIFSTCRVVKQLWDNGCEGLRSYLHVINLNLLSMSFSLSIMFFCRWCVRLSAHCTSLFVSPGICPFHSPPLKGSSQLLRFEGLSVTLPTHAGYKSGLWFMVIQLKAYVGFPNRSWSQVLLLFWIKSSKNVTTKLSGVTFLWHTCKGAREKLKSFRGS